MDIQFKLVDPNKAKAYLGMEDSFLMPHVLVNTKKGMAFVCDEGVGIFEEDDKLTLFIGDTTARIPKADIDQVMSTETITLRELIGRYNNRYLSNLFLWEEAVSEVSQEVVLT